MSTEPEPERVYLGLFQSGRRRDFWGFIDRDVLGKIREQIVDIGPAPSNGREIDLWIESWGGDANVAYKLLLFLRSGFTRIRAVVPDFAKSAATLLAIGCDEIYMAPDAELGPLDVQIQHPDRENVTVSGLNVAKSLGFLVDFALDTVAKKGDLLLEATGLTRLEILRELSRFSSRIVEQVVAKSKLDDIFEEEDDSEIEEDDERHEEHDESIL